MKDLVVALFLVAQSFALYSQSEAGRLADSTSIEQKLQFGITLGVNHSLLLLNDDQLPDNVNVSDGTGFRLGILADYGITNALHVSPKAEISFNSGAAIFRNTGLEDLSYEFFPVSLDLMLHVILKRWNEGLRPYFYVGPNFRIPISGKGFRTNVSSSNPDYAIDFGIGIEKPLSLFKVLPELRYTYGLRNINRHSALPSINFHSISLGFNFMG